MPWKLWNPYIKGQLAFGVINISIVKQRGGTRVYLLARDSDSISSALMVESLLASQCLPFLVDMVFSLSWRATILSVGLMVLTSTDVKTELSSTGWTMTMLDKSRYPAPPCIIPGLAAPPERRSLPCRAPSPSGRLGWDSRGSPVKRYSHTSSVIESCHALYLVRLFLPGDVVLQA